MDCRWNAWKIVALRSLAAVSPFSDLADISKRMMFSGKNTWILRDKSSRPDWIEKDLLISKFFLFRGICPFSIHSKLELFIQEDKIVSSQLKEPNNSRQYYHFQNIGYYWRGCVLITVYHFSWITDMCRGMEVPNLLWHRRAPNWNYNLR